MKKIVCRIFVIIIFVNSCSNEIIKETIGIQKIIEFELEVIRKTSIDEADLIGVSIIDEEVYIKKLYQNEKVWIIQIFDFKGRKKKDIELKKGSGESPDSFFNPIFMKKVRDYYIVADHVYKIVILKEDFSIEKALMFFSYRFFIDFFHFNDRLCLLSEKFYRNNAVICKINLFKLGNNKLEKIKKLHTYNMAYPVSENKSNSYLNKFVPVEFMWEVPFGLYKEGKIYFNLSSEKKLIEFNLKNKEKEIINLNFLKGKEYSKKTVQKIGLYYSSDESLKSTRFLKDKRHDYIPFGKKLYHLGMYDLGKNKIGFIGEINTEKMQFRVDVINLKEFKYEKSIWFPMVSSFLASLQYVNPYGYSTFFDLDKNVFINYDLTNKTESDEYSVNIINFKLKSEKE